MTEAEWLASTDPAAMLAWLNNAVRGVTYDNPVISAGIPVASPRKLRLFACACCRQPDVWSRLVDDVACYGCSGSGTLKVKRRGPGPEPKKTYIVDPPGFPCPDCSGTGRINRSRRAVEVAERFADGLATDRELEYARMPISPNTANPAYWTCFDVSPPAVWLPDFIANQFVAPTVQADLLRHIVGNPFRAVKEPSRWVDDPQSGKGWSSLGYREHVPFKPTQLVLDIAQQVYDGDQSRAPILHDALIDAGADEDSELVRHFEEGETVIEEGCELCSGTGQVEVDFDYHPSGGVGHCPESYDERGRYIGNVCKPRVVVPQTHPKGCWALDLILGKE